MSVRKTINRRSLLLYAAGAELAAQSAAAEGCVTDAGVVDGLNFHISPSAGANFGNQQQAAITRAAYSLLSDLHPAGMKLAFWDKNPNDIPGLKIHLERIVAELFSGIRSNSGVHFVDPLLMLSIFYNESRFSPYAVSPAGAVGIAQFMPETALEYGLSPVAHIELWQEFKQVRNDERKQLATTKNEFQTKHALGSFSASAVISKSLETSNLQVLQEFQAINANLSQAEKIRKNYVATLKKDLNGFDLLANDQSKLQTLDARATYQSVSSAVTYMAKRLVENRGTVTSAIAAYNAGPRAVRDSNRNSVLYGYGTLPAIPETTRFLQRVLIVYSELKKRLP